MKGITWLLGVALAIVACTALARVETTKDRFAAGPRVAMDSGDYPHETSFYVIVKVNPAKPLSEQTATITLKSIGGRYERCFATNWLLDDHPVETDDAVYRGKLTAGEFQIRMDLIDQTVPWSTMVAIANAKTAEFQICRDEYKMSEADSAQLKEMVKQVEVALQKP